MNKNSTRYYSNNQEKSVAKSTKSKQQVSSGSGLFNKGDVINKDASLLIECKTCLTDKSSFSIKENWLSKVKEEAFAQNIENTSLAFNFGPNKTNYYIIDQKLMNFLIDKLIDENKETIEMLAVDLTEDVANDIHRKSLEGYTTDAWCRNYLIRNIHTPNVEYINHYVLGSSLVIQYKR